MTVTTASERKDVQLLLKNYVHLRNILKWKQLKIKMFMYFWLNYCDENHIEGVPFAVKNMDHLFNLASEIIKSDRLHLILLSGDTRIDDNEYLENLENGTELIVCKSKNYRSILNWYLSLKSIDYPLSIDHFIWRLAAILK